MAIGYSKEQAQEDIRHAYGDLKAARRVGDKDVIEEAEKHLDKVLGVYGAAYSGRQGTGGR